MQHLKAVAERVKGLFPTPAEDPTVVTFSKMADPALIISDTVPHTAVPQLVCPVVARFVTPSSFRLTTIAAIAPYVKTMELLGDDPAPFSTLLEKKIRCANVEKAVFKMGNSKRDEHSALVRAAELERLIDVAKVTSLTLIGWDRDLAPADVASLFRPMLNLKHLSLCGALCRPEVAVAAVKQLPALVSLATTCVQIESVGDAQALLQDSTLTDLRITFASAFSTRDCRHIAATLTSLTLQTMPIGRSIMGLVLRAKALRTLAFIQCSMETQLAADFKAANMGSLAPDVSLHDRTLATLFQSRPQDANETFDHIESLCFEGGRPGLFDLAPAFANVTAFRFHCHGIPVRLFSVIAKMTKIKGLSMPDCRWLTEAAVESLAPLTALESVNFTDSLMLTPACFRTMKRVFPRLKKMNLTRCVELTPESVQAIAAIPTLTTVDFTHCITQASFRLRDLACFADHKSLVELRVTVTPEMIQFADLPPRVMQCLVCGRESTRMPIAAPADADPYT